MHSTSRSWMEYLGMLDCLVPVAPIFEYFWLTAGKIPSRKKPKEVPEPTPPIENTLQPSRETSGSIKLENGHDKYRVVITTSEIMVPEFLSLENEHTQVLEEIQGLLKEHHSGGNTPARREDMV